MIDYKYHNSMIVITICGPLELVGGSNTLSLQESV